MPDEFTVDLSRAEIQLLIEGLDWYESEATEEVPGLLELRNRLQMLIGKKVD